MLFRSDLGCFLNLYLCGYVSTQNTPKDYWAMFEKGLLKVIFISELKQKESLGVQKEKC